MSRHAPLTLYLVRHGVIEGADGRCIGQTDLSLAPGACDALARLADGWPSPRPPRLVCSDLARARESAEVLAKVWGHSGPVPTDARLREMDFGEWDGRLWAEMERDDTQAFGAWMADWQTGRVPGGEGFGDVVARVTEWLREEAAGGGEIVVVAHAGSIRALLVQALGLSRGGVFRIRFDHAKVTGVRIVAGEGELLFANVDRVAV